MTSTCCLEIRLLHQSLAAEFTGRQWKHLVKVVVDYCRGHDLVNTDTRKVLKVEGQSPVETWHTFKGDNDFTSEVAIVIDWSWGSLREEKFYGITERSHFDWQQGMISTGSILLRLTSNLVREESTWFGPINEQELARFLLRHGTDQVRARICPMLDS